jgi:hypothetical protein
MTNGFIEISNHPPACRAGAEGQRQMSAEGLQQLEQLAAKLLTTARELPPGLDRSNMLKEIGRFRSQIISLQGVRPTRRGLKVKAK